MLSRLTISNYALIDELNVHFDQGFNIITGETGAGKSIILGALSLILGARAEAGSHRDPSRKCIVEGAFRMDGLQMESFFAENDLDYENTAILRREILASGKSRAFINDTPVNLQQLRELTLRLVDIHSQHQNLELGSQKFQLQIVDMVAGNQAILAEYRQIYSETASLKARLEELREKAGRSKAELDYHQFQFTQLEEARLSEGEQEELEEEREKLLHAGEIKSTLVQVSALLDGDHFPVLPQVKDALRAFDRIRNYIREAGEFHDRLDSIYLELQDIAHETASLAESTEFNPERMEKISGRLDLLYTLQQKHHCNSVADLIRLKDDLERRISEVTEFEEEINRVESELADSRKRLSSAAYKLTDSRKGVFRGMEERVSGVLVMLGIPNAVFRITHTAAPAFNASGNDLIQFLFSANKNVAPDEISRIASGGEISRVMLAIKALVSDSRMLPTIIFDEIDSGISGEIALKMGDILKKLSRGVQVINITHLPQIAGKGDHHFKVYKTDNESATVTSIRKLTDPERIEELAIMVGGANPSDTARKTAREMLQN